jgi:actin-related protein
VCAHHAVGRTIGTVVDVGYSGTTVTPVFDGFVETKRILRSQGKKARMKIKSAVDYDLPLYHQARSSAVENHKMRMEPFHTLASLNFARVWRMAVVLESQPLDMRRCKF